MMTEADNAVVKLVFEEKDTGEKKKGWFLSLSLSLSLSLPYRVQKNKSSWTGIPIQLRLFFWTTRYYRNTLVP